MKFTIEATPEQNPDAVGEFLRSVFFDEKMVGSRFGGKYRETGCYTTFDWREDVEELPRVPVCTEDDGSQAEGFEDLQWIRGRKNLGKRHVECRYYWDGDGTLAFGFPDGSWLFNDDCKKTFGWEYHEKWPLED